MALGGMSFVLLFLIFYFVKKTGAEQNLDLDYAVEFHPKRTTVLAAMDIEAPPKVVWKMLTDMSNYRLWLPWIHRVRVTNNDIDRWVHKHSLLKYNMEVGSCFEVQPFLGAPYNGCRFIAIDPEKKLMMEMLDFVDEVVDDLGSRKYINHINNILENGSSADKQIEVFNQENDIKRVVDHLISETYRDVT